ncbi:MAG TPA: adenylate/guanylate cyclase domain-containing protein, partial [Ktedonobacteraceae bacterium]
MPEERKLVTILFADVTGSTALGESIDPEDLRALMGRYYSHARRVVAAHDGTIEKFIGDDTWLDARLFLLGVESENVVKVFGAIND